MLNFRSTRVGTRLAILFGCTMAGLALLTTAAMTSINTIKVNGPIYAEIVSNKDLLADILPPPHFIIESYLLTHEIADEEDPAALSALLQRAGQLESEYNTRHEHWAQVLPEDERKKTLMDKAHAPVEEFFRLREAVLVPAVRAGDNDRAREIVDSQLRPLYLQHRQAIDRVVELTDQSAARQEQAARTEIAGRVTFIWISLGVIAGVVSLIAWFIARSVSRPIGIITQTMRQLSTGDLRARADVSDGGELGVLASAVNETATSMAQLIGQVVSASGDVAAAATQIAASAEEMAAGLASQESQTSQVSSAVQEMTHSVAEVVRKSSECATASSDSRVQAEQGGQVVHETVSEMTKIAADVAQSVEAVTGLGAKSQTIGEIIKVINDIADQTNLLALNAAIEAARAGEHGRGFAVVADEVRKLAERTTTATEEVAGSIRDIQAETTKAVTRIEAGADRVQRGVSLATGAGEALGRIVESSHHVLEMVNTIAAAAEEQAAASEQIARSIDQINAVTRESNEGASQASMAANLLSEQAEGLRSTVSRFKV